MSRGTQGLFLAVSLYWASSLVKDTRRGRAQDDIGCTRCTGTNKGREVVGARLLDVVLLCSCAALAVIALVSASILDTQLLDHRNQNG